MVIESNMSDVVPIHAPLSLPQLRRFLTSGRPSPSTSYKQLRKEEIIRQLWYYDIKFTRAQRLQTLEKYLNEAVESGKCDTVPLRVQEYHRRQREAEQQRETKWLACTTPTERAKSDIDRFLSHYFLTNGRPDPTKTPEALAMYGFKDRHMLYNAANRISGLETISAGEGPEKTVCIGWGHDAVWKKVHEVDRELAGNSAKRFEKAMQKHHQIVEDVKRSPLVPLSRFGPGGIGKYVGSYIIRCDSLDLEMPTIDIGLWRASGNPTVLAAAVDFGIVEGTMLLALSKAALAKSDVSDDLEYDELSRAVRAYNREADALPEGADAKTLITFIHKFKKRFKLELRREMTDGETDSEESSVDSQDRSSVEHDVHDERFDDDIDDEELYDAEEELEPLAGARKRKAAGPSAETHPEHTSKKTKNASESKGTRVYLLFKGRETGEGQMFVDAHEGYFDFTDETCSAFNGKVSIPYVGANVEMEGFKVSNRPNATAEDWNTFTEAQYDRERVQRWR